MYSNCLSPTYIFLCLLSFLGYVNFICHYTWDKADKNGEFVVYITRMNLISELKSNNLLICFMHLDNSGQD